MINIDKVKAAFASTRAFCQSTFYETRPDGSAAMCALSALVSAAGVHPDLIGKFAATRQQLIEFFVPVLEVEYGIPRQILGDVTTTFDRQTNEFRAIDAVIRLFETFNANEVLRIQAREQAMKKLLFGEMSMFEISFGVSPLESFLSTVKKEHEEKIFGKLGAPEPKGLLNGSSLITYVGYDKPTSSLAVQDGELAKAIGLEIKPPITNPIGENGPKLITKLVGPDEQIIKRAKTLDGFKADGIKLEAQMVGAVSEWKSP